MLTDTILCSTANIFVWIPISIRKQMSLIVYQLAHGFSCKAMNNLYCCRESIIRKYTLIVCKVLPCQDGLFSTYIHVPRRYRLVDTIWKFREITSLPNVVGAIDGIYIPLSSRPQRSLTSMPFDFFNRKNSIKYSYNQCAI